MTPKLAAHPASAAFLARREFLTTAASGLGAIGLGATLDDDGVFAAGASSDTTSRTHFAPRAKSCIFIFMAGAPSQLDLFDPKPAMQKLHGEPVPGSFLAGLEDPLIKGSARVFASPRTFLRYGESGTEYSDYVPHLGGVGDHACMVRSVYTDVANHHPAQLIMNCGTNLWGHPSFGSWVSWGLGNAADNMPGFVVLLSNSGHGVDGGASLWSNGFLPSIYRGTTFRSKGDPILHLANPEGMTRGV
ncbi:MAG TPA: sulfatase, partial [Planctomycetaceae bacterium]|nr:sulfatase [Planctomycetaceae bacterium]